MTSEYQWEEENFGDGQDWVLFDGSSRIGFYATARIMLRGDTYCGYYCLVCNETDYGATDEVFVEQSKSLDEIKAKLELKFEELQNVVSVFEEAVTKSPVIRKFVLETITEKL